MLFVSIDNIKNCIRDIEYLKEYFQELLTEEDNYLIIDSFIVDVKGTFLQYPQITDYILSRDNKVLPLGEIQIFVEENQEYLRQQEEWLKHHRNDDVIIEEI